VCNGWPQIKSRTAARILLSEEEVEQRESGEMGEYGEEQRWQL